MRKWMSVFVVAAFMVAAAAPAAMAAARVHKVMGKVAQVNASKKEVVVNAKLKNGKWKKVPFSLSDQSKIVAGHEKRALSDLKAGDYVTVSYTLKGKTHEVQEISVHPQKAAAHAKDEKKTEKKTEEKTEKKK